MTAPQCTDVPANYEGTTLHRPHCPHRVNEHSFEAFPPGDLNWRKCAACGTLARMEYGRLVIKQVVVR
jgi:hypothetical protein